MLMDAYLYNNKIKDTSKEITNRLALISPMDVYSVKELQQRIRHAVLLPLKK